MSNRLNDILESILNLLMLTAGCICSVSIKKLIQIMNTTTWKTKCKCGEDVYYYPQKLLLETQKQSDVDMTKRIVSLTCCSECKKTIDYEFPTEFEKIS